MYVYVEKSRKIINIIVLSLPKFGADTFVAVMSVIASCVRISSDIVV